MGQLNPDRAWAWGTAERAFKRALELIPAFDAFRS
jgi:hypothetical protein